MRPRAAVGTRVRRVHGIRVGTCGRMEILGGVGPEARRFCHTDRETGRAAGAAAAAFMGAAVAGA